MPKKTKSRRGRKKTKQDGIPKEWALRQKYAEFWAHMVSIKAPHLVIKQVGKTPQVSSPGYAVHTYTIHIPKRNAASERQPIFVASGGSGVRNGVRRPHRRQRNQRARAGALIATSFGVCWQWLVAHTRLRRLADCLHRHPFFFVCQLTCCRCRVCVCVTRRRWRTTRWTGRGAVRSCGRSSTQVISGQGWWLLRVLCGRKHLVGWS